MQLNNNDDLKKATKKLDGWLYDVIVPELASRSDNDIRMYGTFISGNRDVDKDILKKTIRSAMSIFRMLELYKKGIPIRVVKSQDTKDMYESIQAYIYAWKYRLERGVNIGGAPLDDLVALDEFATSVYEPAKYHLKKEEVNSAIISHLSKVNPVNPSNFFNERYNREMANLPRGDNITIENGVTRINAPTEFEQRESQADFFRNRLINTRIRNG